MSAWAGEGVGIEKYGFDSQVELSREWGPRAVEGDVSAVYKREIENALHVRRGFTQAIRSRGFHHNVRVGVAAPESRGLALLAKPQLTARAGDVERRRILKPGVHPGAVAAARVGSARHECALSFRNAASARVEVVGGRTSLGRAKTISEDGSEEMPRLIRGLGRGPVTDGQ